MSSCPGVPKNSSRDFFFSFFGAEISSCVWLSVCPPLPETLTQLLSFSYAPLGTSQTAALRKRKAKSGDLFDKQTLV